MMAVYELVFDQDAPVFIGKVYSNCTNYIYRQQFVTSLTACHNLFEKIYTFSLVPDSILKWTNSSFVISSCHNQYRAEVE